MTAYGVAPHEFLHVPEEEAQRNGDGYDAKKCHKTAQPRPFDKAEWIALPNSFHKPHHNGAAHDPGHMEVGRNSLRKRFPVRRRNGRKVLPRVIQNAHVVVHGHKVDDQTQAERAQPDAEASHRLALVLPGAALQSHNPGRADPRGNNGKHHAGLGRVFCGVEIGQPWQFLQLVRAEIGKCKIAQNIFKKTMNHQYHNAY